ncbi:hypothetical protein GCM10007385_33710 [Tateyamaria omphalii]|nr:hypothetical protein GCM10007385_33710 [Tateyamaria omphalii]
MDECAAAFKVYASLSQYMSDSYALRGSYSQKGKFITVYPKDYRMFLTLVTRLGLKLEGAPHYKVPFERQIPGTPIFYRYGAMSSQTRTILAPDGTERPDNRQKYRPDFIVDPLEPYLEEDLDANDVLQQPSFFNHYLVEDVLSQRGRGGNYLAKSLNDDRSVFVKEGRKFGEHDFFGRSGLSRVENEWTFLSCLNAHGVPTPEPIEFIKSNNHCYLVTELINIRRDVNYSESEREHIANKIATIVKKCHATGIILGDVKLENFLIAEDDVFICDLETASHVTWDVLPSGGTESHLPKKKRLHGISRDNYALAVLLCFFFSDRSTSHRFRAGVNIAKMARQIPGELGIEARRWLRA